MCPERPLLTAEHGHASEIVGTSFLSENKFLFLLFKLLILYWSIVD